MTLSTVLLRGLRKRCPQCGNAPVFKHGWTLQEQCPSCGCGIGSREDDTYFFMYMSTAAITGMFVILMILIRPANKDLGRVVVAVGAVCAFFFSNPYRKSLAIALDYWIETFKPRER